MLSEREAGRPCGALAESAPAARQEEAASEHHSLRASYFCCRLTGLVATAASNLMPLGCAVDVGVDRRETQVSVKPWGG